MNGWVLYEAKFRDLAQYYSIKNLLSIKMQYYCLRPLASGHNMIGLGGQYIESKVGKQCLTTVRDHWWNKSSITNISNLLASPHNDQSLFYNVSNIESLHI